ncbi:hypothetical protein EON82_12355 [bacterium]|nr:MAG: hypothetical protein EON82_12355 [bacterium]
MRWFRRRKDELQISISDPDPNYYTVQVRGLDFHHYTHGRVGFYAGRRVVAPNKENAVAQVMAVLPVQLQPYGEQGAEFEITVESVDETTLKQIMKFAPNGFTFFKGPDGVQ